MILILACSPLFGQWQIKETSAKKINQPLTLDGLIKEAVWQTAPEAGDFIQMQPERGRLASLNTIVKILYDQNYIYFGFLCYDPEPEKIAARLSKRDADLREDDSVYVIIDTFHDKRNSYYVGTNLLGTQWDGRITDNGRYNDSTWDGIWKSTAQRTDFGWSAEIAIELSSIKYQPGKNKTWGLSLGRGIPRALEFSFWTGPLESAYMVSQYGNLTGLNLEKAKKKAQVIPHIISKLEQDRNSDVEAGIDARYAFSQTVSGNLTINPDFATVEADQEQINLSRYELNLSEKRNFFLEGSEIYSQRIRLFYSRRISDIYGGLKLYGKSGGFEFSGLSAQTKKDETAGLDSGNFTVFRLKKDILKSSNIGFIMANKLVGGKNKGAAGLDTALYFSDKLRFTGQLALSYGDYNHDNIAFFLRPSYDSTNSHFHVRYSHYGERFGDNANEVGFIRDDNRHEFDSALEKTFWTKKWGLERIQYESNYNIYWGVDGTLRSWGIDEELSFDWKNKFSFSGEHHQEFKLFEKKFRNNQTEFQLGYNTRESQSASLAYIFGHNFDQDFHLVEGSLNYNITQTFSFQYSLEYLNLKPDPGKESTWIHVIRASNYFTNDLFLKVFFQTNSSIDKRNIQVLFVYRFQPPFGSLQLAYQKGTARFGEKGSQGHTLFIKFAYMF